MREIMNLNFGWRFSPDFRQEYSRPDFKDSAFKLVDLPHVIHDVPLSYVSEKQFQRVSCYRKMFMMTETMKKRRLFLHFEGVMGSAAAFVNGKPVCAHKGGFSPFVCEITGEVSEYINDGENLLTVVVDSTEREDTAPYGDESEQLFFGGIYREVWIEAVDDVFVTEVYPRPVREDKAWALQIDGKLSSPEGGEIRLYLYDGEQKLFVKYINCTSDTFSHKLVIPAPIRPWSPSDPKLYRFAVTVGNGDEYSMMIGFREAEFRQDGFYLNGEKVMLLGLARNQSYARAGNAMPECVQRRDAELLRELGCNFVRTMNSPPSKHFLDACDELGVMVLAELPGKGYVGGNEWRDCLLENMRELVLRDRHHPSIILWGTRTEESADCDELYSRTLGIVSELDGSRQTTGIRSTPCAGAILEDVYSYNDYSHSGEAQALEKRRTVVKAKIPYLVTGHTGWKYPVRDTDSELMRIEHALRHARALDAAYAEQEACGVVGICLADFNARSRYGGGDNLCAFGVTSSARVKKLAAYVYESQSDDHPVMALSSSLCGGDSPGTPLGKAYVFTNCDSVRLLRNGKPVGTFLPDRKNFPNLPHPPVLIDDFIGDLLVTEEHIDPRDAPTVKNALVLMSRDGECPSDGRARAAAAMSKYKLSTEEFSALYAKYFAGRFGGARFAFEGIKNGEVVRSIVSEPVLETGMTVTCDRHELVSRDTYDCARIELTAVDQNGCRLYGCSDAVSVECEGSLEVIGSRIFALTGGAAAFYVRTKGGKGVAKVRITTESLGSHVVELNITRILPGKKNDGRKK